VGRKMVGTTGFGTSPTLSHCNLLIPRSEKTHKNDRKAEVRYTAGTRSVEVRPAEVRHAGH
jgi:hypothetical protein